MSDNSASDKTVLVPSLDQQREFALQQIHLRFKRCEVEPAFRAICRLRASSKTHPDIEQLYSDIVSVRGHERAAPNDKVDRLRQVRDYPGMQASRSRTSLRVAGAAVIAYSMWHGRRA